MSAFPPPVAAADAPPPPPYSGPAFIQPPPAAYAPPVVALAPPGPQELALARDAFALAFPMWQTRLAAAFGGKPVPFIFNLEVVLASLPHTLSRFSALQLLVGSPPKFSGCLLESLVKSIEKACCEPAVRRDFAARIGQIDVVNLPSLKATDKSIALHGTTLVLTVVLNSGLAGSHRTEAIAEFFEKTFYAEERYLTTRFMHESLPNAQKAIAGALCRPDFAIQLDIVAEIGKVGSQADRLPAAQTLVSVSGVERSIEETSLLVDRAIVSVVRSAEVACNGRADTPAISKTSVDVINSPHFLRPLVLAVQKICGCDAGATAIINQTIAAIHVENLPGKDSKHKSLSLAAGLTSPPAPPTPTGTPALHGGMLIYRMVLGAGSSGLFTEKEIEAFFELHFKAQEKGLVTRLLQQDAPAAQGALLNLFAHPVPIEFVWASIFPDVLTTKERLVTAEALTLNRSEHFLQPIVQAFTDVLNDGPIAKGVLIPAIMKIAVQCTPGVGASSGVATLYLAPLPTGGQVLVYSPALLLGIRGCLSRFEFRDKLRALFGLPKPASEKGLGASLGKVTADLNKLGTSIFGSKLF